MNDPTPYDYSMMTFEEAHQILRDIGLTMESRNWLKVNEQLLKIAAIVVNNGGLGKIDEETINELAQKNRLMDVAIAVEKRRLLREKKREELRAKAAGLTKASVEATLSQERSELSNLKDNSATAGEKKIDLSNQKNYLVEKAHRILEEVGFDAAARDCLEKRRQLIDVALIAEKRGFQFFDIDVLNRHAKENRLMEIVTSLGQGIMFYHKAHLILKDIGFNEEARECLERNGHLFDIAVIAEKYNKWRFTSMWLKVAENRRRLTVLNKATIDRFLQMNPVMTEDCIEKLIDMGNVHLILKEVGFNEEARECLERSGQLINIATIAEKYRVHWKETLNKIANKLAIENRIKELVAVAENSRRLSALNEAIIDRFLQMNPVMTEDCIEKLVDIGKAHLMLKEVGFNEEARNCLERNGQLCNIATIAEKYKGEWKIASKWLSALDKATMDRFLQMNPVMTEDCIEKLVDIGKAHLILKEIGFNEEARECLERNGQLFDIAVIAEKYRVHWRSDKEALNKLSNKLAIENRIKELVAVAENSRWLSALNEATIDSFLKKNSVITEYGIEKLVDIGKAHLMLKEVGFNEEARECLEKNGQLYSVAAIVEKYKGEIQINNEWLAALNEAAIDRFLQMNPVITEDCIEKLVDIGIAHLMLKEIGFNEEARNCLERNGQLYNIVVIAEKYKGEWKIAGRWLAALDEATIDRFLQMNPVMTEDCIEKLVDIGKALGKAHLILEEVGFSEEARECLERNGHLFDIATIAEKYRVNWKEALNKLSNKLAIENRIKELVTVAENSRRLSVLNAATIDSFLKKNPVITEYGIEKLAGEGKIKVIKNQRDNIVRSAYKEYLSDFRTLACKKVVIKKEGTLKKRHVNRNKKLSSQHKLLLKGKYIRLVLSHCNYLLTLNQLCDMSKNLMTPKDIEKLCDKRIIYRQEQNGTYLYAENKSNFKQNWNSQIEYFNKLFNRPGFTKTKRLISSLMKKALLEKKWFLDEIYVSILISKVLQIPANIHENITEKKRKKESTQKDK